ncbi:hypothetical protein VVT58_16550 (plasmid) [Sphingobium sp. SJ10-10]|uniref:hypothetical protein n=1 Tax=unclassified Sphingobium TaxID=2611147 RepID=UPI0011A57FED|nr:MULTISPECIES: hypothetical protein [unclassified Sphingobium]MEC6701755.1 hypothetical protein [Sphingobium sp. SJ10-10]
MIDLQHGSSISNLNSPRQRQYSCRKPRISVALSDALREMAVQGKSRMATIKPAAVRGFAPKNAQRPRFDVCIISHGLDCRNSAFASFLRGRKKSRATELRNVVFYGNNVSSMV